MCTFGSILGLCFIMYSMPAWAQRTIGTSNSGGGSLVAGKFVSRAYCSIERAHWADSDIDEEAFVRLLKDPEFRVNLVELFINPLTERPFKNQKDNARASLKSVQLSKEFWKEKRFEPRLAWKLDSLIFHELTRALPPDAPQYDDANYNLSTVKLKLDKKPKQNCSGRLMELDVEPYFQASMAFNILKTVHDQKLILSSIDWHQNNYGEIIPFKTISIWHTTHGFMGKTKVHYSIGSAEVEIIEFSQSEFQSNIFYAKGNQIVRYGTIAICSTPVELTFLTGETILKRSKKKGSVPRLLNKIRLIATIPATIKSEMTSQSECSEIAHENNIHEYSGYFYGGKVQQ